MPRVRRAGAGGLPGPRRQRLGRRRQVPALPCRRQRDDAPDLGLLEAAERGLGTLVGGIAETTTAQQSARGASGRLGTAGRAHVPPRLKRFPVGTPQGTKHRRKKIPKAGDVDLRLHCGPKARGSSSAAAPARVDTQVAAPRESSSMLPSRIRNVLIATCAALALTASVAGAAGPIVEFSDGIASGSRGIT